MSPSDDVDDACDNTTCSADNGGCYTENGTATCFCNSGYMLVDGTNCTGNMQVQKCTIHIKGSYRLMPKTYVKIIFSCRSTILYMSLLF